MGIEEADAFAAYLVPEIDAGKTTAQEATRAIRYKQAGLDYVAACKNASMVDGVVDVTALKEKIDAAVVFLQQYSAELVPTP